MNALLDWFNHGELHSLYTSPLFALTLSLAAFQFGQWVYRLSGNFPLLHPTMFGAVTVAILLKLLAIDFTQYFAGNALLMFLLGPATVALAIPLFQQLRLMRGMLLPMSITIVAGASFAALSAVAIAYALGASPEVLLSLAPKSVTTPIAMSIADEIGGIQTLATGAVVLTAVVGIVVAPWIFSLLKINDPRVWGFCLGITAHGVGTARSFELNATAGAFASLALCLTGTFSAIVIPLVATMLNAIH
jgi:putative effector of murein hydrolase